MLILRGRILVAFYCILCVLATSHSLVVCSLAPVAAVELPSMALPSIVCLPNVFVYRTPYLANTFGAVDVQLLRLCLLYGKHRVSVRYGYASDRMTDPFFMAGSTLWHKGSASVACFGISCVFLLCSALLLFLRFYFCFYFGLALFGSRILEVSLREFCNIIRCGNFPCTFFYIFRLFYWLAALL